MKSFSELTSASQVNNADILAISQENSGSYASKKTTVKDVTDKANLNLAEEYDSTSTYAVDDYVIYESVLYKCIASTTGTFDSTKWTSVVVTDEMGSGGGGGTGGHTIIDENGNSMTARAGLQFVGADVSDDATNNKTIVDLASAGGIDGVFADFNNVIVAQTNVPASDIASWSYTATEDCVIYISIQNNAGQSAQIRIDGKNIAQASGSYAYRVTSFTALKKGQVVTVTGNVNTSVNTQYSVYGIQTGTTHSKFQPVIYSTEEREIGVWTDGKPLYQKTVVLASSMSIASNTWTDIDDGDWSFVDTFVLGLIVNTNGASVGFVAVDKNTNNNKLRILQTRSTDITCKSVTIQYTKTSDTAGSGSWTPQGVPAVHYSTDEQVIGTYLGETLYQKTINSTLNLSSSWQNYFDMSNKNLVDVSKIKLERDGERCSTAFSPYQIVSYIVRDNYLKFCLQTSGSSDPYVLYSATVQYTKTS